MLRRSTLTMLLTMLSAVLLVAGCSDDDSTDPISNVGNPNAAQFQGMREAIGTAVDSTLGIMLDFAANPNRFPRDPQNPRPELGIMNPEDSVLYNYTNGWHILYLGLTSSADQNDVYVDSACFYSHGEVVDQANLVTDEAYFIHHQTNTYTGDGSVYQNIEGYVNLQFTDFWSETPEINGLGGFTVEDHYLVDQVPVLDNYEFDITMTDVVIDWHPNYTWDQVTPISGTVSFDCTCTQDETVEEWSVMATVQSDGDVDIHAVHNGMTYDFEMTPFSN